MSETTVIKNPSSKKKKKEPWEVVLKDRFLRNEKPENPYIMAFLYFIVFFLSFLLVFVCFFQLCKVQGSSMQNTLYGGDHVLLFRTTSTYKRGDIVVITKGDENEYNIIKRVIATEGDALLFHVVDPTDKESEVTVQLKKKDSDTFELLEEKFIAEPMKKNQSFRAGFEFDTEILIPEKHIFVMGDNRNHSEDSRSEDGAYPISSVYGKSFMKVSKGSILEKLLSFLYHENNAT